MRTLLAAHTPIPFDRDNPGYATWLEQGHAESRALALAATDAAGHHYALARYVHGFGDPHFALKPARPLPPPRWPGFVVAARDDGAIVTWRDAADAAAPPPGSTITACDGRPLADLVAQRLHPFVLNPGLAIDRRRGATRLFLDRGNPFAPAPARCSAIVAGEPRELELRWRALPADEDAYWQAFDAAAVGPSAEWGVSEPAAGVFWIGVPTFASGEDTGPRLAALVEEVRDRGEALRAARAVVLDVRGNGGGNSAWADRLAQALFGEEPVRRAKALLPDAAVDWRASTGNVAYWRAWLEEVGVREFGEDSETMTVARRMLAEIEAAIDRDPPLWREGPAEVAAGGGITRRRPAGERPLSAQVYLLSNGSCASSCLNFADTVLQIPGVQLIGSATSGDGVYMEVRTVDLPSGHATLTFAQKVRRGGGRGPLEAYEPDVAYEGPWDDASVRAWVMGRVSGASEREGCGCPDAGGLPSPRDGTAAN